MQDYQNGNEQMKISHPRLIKIDYVRKQMVIKGIFFFSLSFSATKLQIDEYRIPSDFSILSRPRCYLKLQMKIQKKWRKIK